MTKHLTEVAPRANKVNPAVGEAFSRLLDMVKEVGARRVFTVFGCEGDRDKAVRPVLGEIAHYKVLNFRQRQSHRPQLLADEIIEKLFSDRLALDDSLEARLQALVLCQIRILG